MSIWVAFGIGAVVWLFFRRFLRWWHFFLFLVICFLVVYFVSPSLHHTVQHVVSSGFLRAR
ncbi:MAG: hypothetical protein OWR62_13815 [Sulfobacillus thermotolerans]|nr:hypothetical protein [Sulfobacillus thermotolerans]